MLTAIMVILEWIFFCHSRAIGEICVDILLHEQVNRCNKNEVCLGNTHFHYAIVDSHSLSSAKKISAKWKRLLGSNTDYSGQMTAVVFTSIIAFNWSADGQFCPCDVSRDASRPKIPTKSIFIKFHNVYIFFNCL